MFDDKLYNRQSENNNGRHAQRQETLRMPASCRPACPETPLQTIQRRWTCHINVLSRRGQQIVEYALLISFISLALTTMYMYSKRGLQAVIKGAADQIGTQESSEPKTGAMTNSISVSDTYASQTGTVKKVNEDRITETQAVSFSAGNASTLTINY